MERAAQAKDEERKSEIKKHLNDPTKLNKMFDDALRHRKKKVQQRHRRKE